MRADILVAGPNLAIDRTLSTAELRPGGADTVVDEAVVTAGGKGVNVARAVGALGLRATLVGLLPGTFGRAVAAMLADEGIDVIGVPVAGELRFASIILERGGRATVLNEPGPELSEDDWLAYEAATTGAIADHGIVVCSGSLPPAARSDAYALVVAAARERDRPVVVDAGGEVLLAALGERPDVVCPNLAEAEGALNGAGAEAVTAPSDARDRSAAVAAELVRRGARAAIVTAASAGVAVADRRGPEWIAAPAVSVANPMGAGDALAAGLAVALAQGRDLRSAARLAVAAGSASVEHPRAGRLDPRRAAELAGSLGISQYS